MGDATLQRRGWLVSATCLVLWAASTLSFAWYAFVVGLSAAQRQALEQFLSRPFETTIEPLVALLASTIVLGVLTGFSLVYYGYVQWRYARQRRLALEYELEADRQ
ncbi:hypothetical protein [Natronorubrum texcoconense]|uniref:DUF1049 domain-containing protein n=1 Tax=Natronorubrum texcoconense TaxID=1095776 RepID=A0A1G9FR24_9EURY|nr:hypothetical protein [Natronorubrum texcoconense]SDK90854.1 hypothetical protein SAMN04515672_4248 [Natronorubrum texcoconense]